MSDKIVEERAAQMLIVARTKTYHSLDELATILGVGTRTVRNYIKQLNSDLEGVATFDNERGKGFRLIIHDVKALQELEDRTNATNLMNPKNRIGFIVERLMNKEEAYTLEDLASDMHLGRTTLVHELKKAAVSLESYQLLIQGTPNRGMELVGRELDLRFYVLDHLYHSLYSHYPIDDDIRSAIEEITNQFNLETPTQTKLLEFTTIMLDRFLKGHPLHELEEKHELLKGTSDYEIAARVAKAIESRLPITIPESEVLFITIPIAGRRTPTSNRTLADITITEDVKKLLEQMIEQVGFSKDVIPQHKGFFQDLQYHLTFMLNRLIFGLRLKNEGLPDVKAKYPVAYKMAELAGEVVHSRYGLDVPEEELGFLAYYFGVFIGKSKRKVNRITRTAVVCGTGRGTAKLVAIQLEGLLNDGTQIDLYAERDATKDLLNRYDMVFSTISLSFKLEVPLIQITEIFDEVKVKKEIEKAIFTQRFNIHGEPHTSIMAQLLETDTFFRLGQFKTYDQALHYMVSEMVRMERVDQGFSKRLKDREAKGSMIFGGGIAFPHTFHYQSDQIELAIGVFPDRMIEQGKNVRLVFLLGLPDTPKDHNEDLIVKIYDEIISVVNQKQMINQLSEVKSYEDFITLIDRGWEEE